MLWHVITELLKAVHAQFFIWFWLYWDIVGPVFNFRSEYWERNARNESTLADCAATFLAVPGGLGAVSIFVWVMRLATICGENLGYAANLIQDLMLDINESY